MCVVLGKDPELEDNMNFQIDQFSSTASQDVQNKIPCGEVVAGEESEMDKEDDMEETVTPLSSFIESTPHSPLSNPAHLHMSILIEYYSL